MMYENSRYLHTPIYTRKGDTSPILKMRNRFDFKIENCKFKMRNRFDFKIENCKLHEWVEGDTLDGVAYRYYGISALRWAILDANPKYRTEFDIEYGDRIFIPDFQEILDIINV